MSFYQTYAQVRFVIESLPEATPATDSIYISGSFNNWNTSDPAYLLEKQPNGQLAISLQINDEISEYKFTRGDWLKVETGQDNAYLPNRILTKEQSDQTVMIKIRNWQDLGGARNFEYLIFYFFAVAFLALILTILSVRIFKKEKQKRRIFALTNSLLIWLFVGVVTYYVVNPIWQTYLVILSEMLLFIWGPILFFFLGSVWRKEHAKIDWRYLYPALFVLLIAVLRLLNLEIVAFLAMNIGGFITVSKVLITGAGVLMVWILLMKFMIEERIFRWPRFDSQQTFSIIFLMANMLGLVILHVSLYLEYAAISEAWIGGYKFFFVVMSFLVWMQVVVLWINPQFFKEKSHNLHIESADRLLFDLRSLMVEDKVYKDAELSVNRLAELMGTKSHILSKLLNEHYEQNFRDFVNTYRVDAFIHLANAGKLEKLTFLGLAHEVGFNSKSTFNLAFKKVTHQSPREYFKKSVV